MDRCSEHCRASAPILSLAMIVKDGGQDLARCLTSARPWVDEIVVVDTGSRDNSRQIARERGARVESYRWCDDFAAARNASLDCCRGRWIVVLDADEMVQVANGLAWRHWLEDCEQTGRVLAARISTRNYLPAGCGKRGWQPLPVGEPFSLPEYPRKLPR